MKKIRNPYIGDEADGYNCFACAPHNPSGLKMEFFEDGDDIVCFWKPTTNYQGWTDTLHGGIQATLIDETCGWLISRKFQLSGMTTNLSVKYKKPVPINDNDIIEIRAKVKEVKRTFVFMEATISMNGEIHTTADVTFFCFSKEKSLTDFNFKPFELEEE
ncbi:MAG: PaaI family thioesterase [Bacteroidaceae bacterium]|jgi:acyl-coenzyme A thioesterase PaaI-like protein|nr:PaaI family thioesterase [Bacteroidaceae bacterium]